MRKALLLITLMVGLTTLTACNFSVDEYKPKVINGLKSMINGSDKTADRMIPNGDREFTFNGKRMHIKKSTFDSLKQYIHGHNDIERAMVDLGGDVITDENIDTIIYYAKKIHIDPEELLDKLK